MEKSGIAKIEIGDIIVTLLVILALYLLINFSFTMELFFKSGLKSHDTVVLQGEEYSTNDIKDVEYIGDYNYHEYKITLRDGTEIIVSDYYFKEG